MIFLYCKAVHIIFVVTWFSGMFYQVRLFIYNREANDKPEPEKTILQNQLGVMIKRLLYGITWPSAVLTLIFGIWILILYSYYPLWLLIKLGLVVLLFIYQYSLQIIYNQQKSGIFKYNSNQLRLWNEVPTVFLVAIVMLVVVKQNVSLFYGLVGLISLIILLLSAMKIYKAVRGDKNYTE